jgi:hypothetical protein
MRKLRTGGMPDDRSENLARGGSDQHSTPCVWHFSKASLRALLVNAPAIVVFGFVEVALFLFGEVAAVLGLFCTFARRNV